MSACVTVKSPVTPQCPVHNPVHRPSLTFGLALSEFSVLSLVAEAWCERGVSTRPIPSTARARVRLFSKATRGRVRSCAVTCRPRPPGGINSYAVLCS